MDTGVKGAKGCIKLIWERDARENEWSEKERNTETEMAGHTQGVGPMRAEPPPAT